MRVDVRIEALDLADGQAGLCRDRRVRIAGMHDPEGREPARRRRLSSPAVGTLGRIVAREREDDNDGREHRRERNRCE